MAELYGNKKIKTANLVWSMDGSNIRSYPGSGTVVNDLHPNTNNGTMINGVTYDVSEKAFSFDGVDDYIDFGSGVKPFITGNMTLDVWVKVVAFSDFKRIISQGRNSGGVGYALIVQSSGEIVFVYNNGSEQAVKTSVLQTGIWYHIVGVFDGSAKIYVNGVLDSSPASTAWTLASDDLTIGRMSASQYFNGFVRSGNGYSSGFVANDVLENFNARKDQFV